MKRLMIGLLTGMLTSVFCCSSAFCADYERKNEDAIFDPITGYNGFDWGTQEKEVYDALITDDMKKGSDYEFDDDHLLFANQSISKFDASIMYTFNSNDELSSVVCSIKNSHTTFVQYLKDLYDLKDVYEYIYGSGETELDIWYDDLYRTGKDSDTAFAIARGDLLRYSIWNGSDGSQVMIYASGNDNKFQTTVIYRGPEQEEQAKNTDGV